MGKILNLILFLIIAFPIIVPSIAYAARPLSTDDAGTVEERHIEIESGFEYVNQTDEENSLNLVLKYGIIKNLDLGTELPYKFINLSGSADVDGIGDIKVTTKYRFLEETKKIPALAFSFSVKTKTGSEAKGIGSGEVDYILNGIITKTIDKFINHLNLGYTFVGEPEEGNPDDIFSYSLALEYPMYERLSIVGEIAGETTFEGDFDDNPCSGLLGLNYALNEMTSFDFGMGFKISDASPDYKIITGLTFGF
ncbi:transporter [Candidatus Omnitrophota bacterium]